MSIPAVADRKQHTSITSTMVYDHYVGDPCYVIPDDRWSEFCDKLFALETYRKYGGGIIRWEVDGETYLIDVHNSPFGDGTWSFDMQDDEGNDIVLGVDAGLLAIVPMECVCPKADFYLGAVFHGEPTLETLEQDGGIVELNGQRNKGTTNPSVSSAVTTTLTLSIARQRAVMCVGCVGKNRRKRNDCEQNAGLARRSQAVAEAQRMVGGSSCTSPRGRY